MSVDGRMQQVFSVSYLANKIGKSDSIIRRWLCEGVVPDNGIFIGNTRYFTSDEVEIIKACAEETYILRDRNRFLLNDFSQKVTERLNDYRKGNHYAEGFTKNASTGHNT